MALNTNPDSSDENDGKHSTDEEMTFDDVLKSSLRERNQQRETLDELVRTDRSSTEQEKTNQVKQHNRAANRRQEEANSRRRKAIANAIGEKHFANNSHTRICTGETKRIGRKTIYEFAKVEVENETYYYIVQVTDQDHRFKGKAAIKDFGVEWSYSPPSIDRNAVEEIIGRQRQKDIQQSRSPVSWLDQEQYQDLDEWYQSSVDSALLALETRTGKQEFDVRVLSQYLVADTDKSALLRRELRSLSERQIELVMKSMVEIVRPNLDIPPRLLSDLHQTYRYPLLAKMEFDSS